MSDIGLNPVDLDTPSIASASREQRLAMLRQTVGEMVGVTFFGKMLEVARNSVLKSDLGHGGRGEEVFRAQFDLELARRAGQGMSGGLTETIYNRLAKGV